MLQQEKPRAVTLQNVPSRQRNVYDTPELGQAAIVVVVLVVLVEVVEVVVVVLVVVVVVLVVVVVVVVVGVVEVVALVVVVVVVVVVVALVAFKNSVGQTAKRPPTVRQLDCEILKSQQ